MKKANSYLLSILYLLSISAAVVGNRFPEKGTCLMLHGFALPSPLVLVKHFFNRPKVDEGIIAPAHGPGGTMGCYGKIKAGESQQEEG